MRVHDDEFDYTKGKKKDRWKWCKGKVGVYHDVIHYKTGKRGVAEDRCSKCNKGFKVHYKFLWSRHDYVSCHSLVKNPPE